VRNWLSKVKNIVADKIKKLRRIWRPRQPPPVVASPVTLATNALDAVFNLARLRQNEIYQRWISISWAMGGQLPNSLLSVNVQRDGELDQILRCLEDEFLLPETSASMFKAHYSLMLANLWVGGIYETVRLLREIAGRQREHDPIAHDLRLLRVALEKHQIADDRRLTAPLRMTRHPPNDNATDCYVYSPDDPQRSHIMPTGISARGSVMWQVIDLRANTERWIERRDLSDRILNRWSIPAGN
jgi:hypothetical protein